MSANTLANQRAREDFFECLSQLVGAGATWGLEENKEITGSDAVVKITPQSHESAPIDVRLELDWGVYLLFGVAAPFEVPFSERYYTETDWLTELGMLCRAVVDGRFEERLIYIGQKGSTASTGSYWRTAGPSASPGESRPSYPGGKRKPKCVVIEPMMQRLAIPLSVPLWW
ncbi:MAG: hypothetical protein ACYC6M_15135 [Terriglobales bacterium]